MGSKEKWNDRELRLKLTVSIGKFPSAISGGSDVLEVGRVGSMYLAGQHLV
jgi:hypothetical protein